MNDDDTYQPSPEHLAFAHKVAADKMAAMRERLKHTHPRLIGWLGLSPEQLICSEYQCWFQEVLRELRRGERMP